MTGLKGHDSAAFRRTTVGGRRGCRWLRAGLILVERVLMDELGSPVALLRALGDLARS